MKRYLLSIALLFATAIPAAAVDVGVSINVGQPSYYGPLELQGYPQPVFLYPEPIIVRPAPVVHQPVYLRVPPGHAKNWAKHCGRYHACGSPVYFVQDSWYRNVYAPQYKAGHGHGKGHGKKNKH